MKKTLLLVLLITFFGYDLYAQNVNIPDANFKNYLINHASINTNGDNEIQVSEANAYSGSIYVPTLGIANLTGIEAFLKIHYLNVDDNQLTSLDVSNNLRLTFLVCNRNQLTNLDVSNNLMLETLGCGANQLTNLDVSNNSNLTSLGCGANQLISLTGLNNSNLQALSCESNLLTNLDLSNSTDLYYLACESNQFTSLDLSTNVNLERVFARFCNQLTYLNIANGNNQNMINFWISYNPNLFCVDVDDPIYSAANWTNKDPQTNYGTNCSTPVCDITIPDANFKNYLVGNAAINTNGDTEIQCSEATAFTGAIYCQGRQISDLTGIEAFVNVTKLYCNANQLTSLDLSQNTQLTELFCESNQLTNLNITQNSNLTVVNCEHNQLTTIDLTQNSNLVELLCKENGLAVLDLTQNTALEYVSCDLNQLTDLNIDYNVDLAYVSCSDNQITSLDTSNNNKLRILESSNNQVTDLDLTQNVDLISVRATDNQLTTLNVANGFNQNMLDFRITNNPDLLCVTVDDPVYSTTNWTFKDQQTSYSVNCNSTICTVVIPDANFKSYLVNNSLINTNGDSEIQCSEAIAFTGIINCSNKNISDLTGIEAFTALTRLDASQNQLTNLNIATNTSLRYLNCRSNQLTVLDVSNNAGIRILNCSQNQLTNIDVSNNPILLNLYCNENVLTHLNVTANTNLRYLNCKLNQLTTLDVSNNPALDIFYCGNNQITDLDVSNNPSLRYFNSKNSALESLNVANGQNTSMASFDIRNNSNLTCVQVDNTTYSTTFWTNKDAQTNYNTVCPTVPAVPLMNSNIARNTMIYPNPTKGMLYFNTVGTPISKIEILEVSGRLIREEINSTEGVDLSNLNSGLYYVKIFSGDRFTIKRLIKE
jgi:Leucine-rich repeat (LRR) protein